MRNDAALEPRAGHSRTIGVVVLDVGNPFFTSLVRAAEDARSATGSAVLLGDSGHDANRESHDIDLFQEQRVQGLLISPVGDVAAAGSMHSGNAACQRSWWTGWRMRTASAPSRSMTTPAATWPPGTSSISGEGSGPSVGGPVSIRQVSDRLLGARRAVAEVDGAALEVLDSDGQGSVLAGRGVGNGLVDRGAGDMPDGIFCANDLLALGVMQSLTMTNGVHIPDDVALIGYDDIDFAVSAVVPLSSIRQPTDAIGRTAIKLLTEELDAQHPRHRAVVFTPELVVRQSTAGAEAPH